MRLRHLEPDRPAAAHEEVARSCAAPAATERPAGPAPITQISTASFSFMSSRRGLGVAAEPLVDDGDQRQDDEAGDRQENARLQNDGAVRPPAALQNGAE